MEIPILGSGLMMSHQGSACRSQLTVIHTKDNLKRDSNMEKDFFIGLMDHSMKESGWMER